MPIEFSAQAVGDYSPLILLGFIWTFVAIIWGALACWILLKVYRVFFSPYRLIIVDHKGLNTGIARFDLGKVIEEDGVKKLYWHKLRVKTEIPPQDLTFPINPWQNLAIYFRDKNGKLRPWTYELDENAPYMTPYSGDVEFWAKQEMKRVVEQSFKPTAWAKYKGDVMFMITVAVFFLMMIFTINFAQEALGSANAVKQACEAVIK